jgi:gas vesicle protein
MKKALYLILAGVAIGILVAPEKGSETRRKLRTTFDDWKEGAMDQVNDMISQGKDLVGNKKDGVNTEENKALSTADKW